VSQTALNLDKLDGPGSSGFNIDLDKTQIWVIDFEWLGVGKSRFGIVDSEANIVYCHEFRNANVLDVVYMSTPNLPLRYSIENDGTGVATSMDALCATVISEGGQQDIGVLGYQSTEGTHINANTAGTIYAIMGIRLKAANLGTTIKIKGITLINDTNDDFEWLLIMNPTLANSVTFGDKTNSSLQTAVGNPGAHSNSTVTGGTTITGGFVKSGGGSGDVTMGTENALLLGSTIAGVPDELYLCCRPLSANADINGGLTWRELS